MLEFVAFPILLHQNVLHIPHNRVHYGIVEKKDLEGCQDPWDSRDPRNLLNAHNSRNPSNLPDRLETLSKVKGISVQLSGVQNIMANMWKI